MRAPSSRRKRPGPANREHGPCRGPWRSWSPQCYIHHMKHGLFIAVAAVLLCGCGHTAKDPFVGTWAVNPNPGNARIVIWKSGDQYRAAQVIGSAVSAPLTLARHGNELDGTIPPAMGPTKLVIGLLPDHRTAQFRGRSERRVSSERRRHAQGLGLHCAAEPSRVPLVRQPRPRLRLRPPTPACAKRPRTCRRSCERPSPGPKTLAKSRNCAGGSVPLPPGAAGDRQGDDQRERNDDPAVEQLVHGQPLPRHVDESRFDGRRQLHFLAATNASLANVDHVPVSNFMRPSLSRRPLPRHPGAQVTPLSIRAEAA